MIRYQIKVHKEDGSYWGEFPDLPGCFTIGDTKEELLDQARDALSLYLEEARDPQWKIPESRSRAGKSYEWVTPYEDVAIPLMIRQARLKKGIGQRQLAKLLGMSVQQIQRLEMPGKSNPTVKTLSAISRALDEQLEIRLVA
jgi:predicted RNase H-like HicB family nuclease/DNA-binding XRE family transcriptional regulator